MNLKRRSTTILKTKVQIQYFKGGFENSKTDTHHPSRSLKKKDDACQ